MEPDKAVYDEVVASANKAFVRYGIKEGVVHNYFNYPYPQRLHILREILKVYVLREVGDYRLFIRMSKKINELSGFPAQPLDDCVLQMCQWQEKETDAFRDEDYSGDNIVLSLLVWGESYTQRMIDYLFRSWLAEGNIDALCAEKQAFLYIHTTAASMRMIEESDEARRLKDMGLLFKYSVVPDGLIEYMQYIKMDLEDPSAKFWMVGCSAALGIAFANRIGAAFHQAIPDAIYSAGYFKNTLRLAKKYPAVLDSNIRSDTDSMALVMKPYLKDGVLSIAAPDLIAHSMNCLHLCFFNQIVNHRKIAGNPDGFPDFHKLYWEGEDTLHINSPHNDMVYLAPELVQRLPDRFFISFDSELDYVVPGEDFYIPQPEDEMYKAEITPPQNYGVVDWYVTVDKFCFNFWQTVSYRDLLKFFVRGSVLKFNPAIRQRRVPPMMPEEIEGEQKLIINALKDSKKALGDMYEVEAA